MGYLRQSSRKDSPAVDTDNRLLILPVSAKTDVTALAELSENSERSAGNEPRPME